MIQLSSYSLSYNGKTLLNNLNEMLWQSNIYQVTTSTDGHGTMSATPMSGFYGTTVTLSNTPNDDYVFSGYSITGASLVGNQFTLNSDVTARAEFGTGFSVTYLSDEHVSCTGDITFYVPGGTGIALQTSYDDYYRISGYEVTGGTVENGILYPTGPCTAKAIEKLNYFTATGSIAWGNNLNDQGQGAREARPTLHIDAYTGDNQSDIEVLDSNYANYGHTGTSTAASTTTANRGWKYSTTTSTCVSFPSGTSAVSLHVNGTYTGEHAGPALAYVGADQRRVTLYVLEQSTVWDSFFPLQKSASINSAFDITETSDMINDTNQYTYFRVYNANDTTGTSYNCGYRWAYNRAMGLSGTFTASGILK